MRQKPRGEDKDKAKTFDFADFWHSFCPHISLFLWNGASLSVTQFLLQHPALTVKTSFDFSVVPTTHHAGMDAMAGFREQQQKWLTTERIHINKCVTWLKESWEEKQEDVMMVYSKMKGIILEDAMPKMHRRKPRKGKSG